jgi:hypothetical protein
LHDGLLRLCRHFSPPAVIKPDYRGDLAPGTFLAVTRAGLGKAYGGDYSPRQQHRLAGSHPEEAKTFFKQGTTPMENHEFTIEVAQEFHRRMAAVIDAVQAGIWKAGLHNLLGYSTDYAFGQDRGLQTLILKSRNRSAYVRLQWDAILSDTPTDRATVDGAIKSAIHELA